MQLDACRVRVLAFAHFTGRCAMRIAVAALFGAIVIFLWQFVSHMLLPIGEMGFRAPQNESAVLQAASSGLPDSGVYLLPYLAPEKMNDATAVQDWTRRAQKNPF